MKEIYRKYLSALRSFIHGTEPESLTPEEAKELLDLATIHSTGGIVASVYRAHPQRIDAQLLPGLRRRCLQEISLYAGRAERMKLLLQKLEEAGIDCVLFKGFVVRNYYPVPELRTFGDIDFVIRKEDREKCHQLMLQLGYEPKDTWEPVYSYRKEAEYYEIHTGIMEVDVSDKAEYMAYFSHLWEHTRPSTLVALPHVLELTPEYHFLYLLTHIAKHISGSGAGIRMYLDIAFFVKHFGDTLDWQWIAGELEKLCLADFANVAFQAVENWFDVACPIAPDPTDEEIMADFLEFTMVGGVYGYVGRDKSLIFLKQQNRNEAEVSKVKTLLLHAFPPVRSLENRYTYLQKAPVLLPVAWIQRLADSRSQWGRFADHTKHIVTADTEEVRKLKRIYKELGL